MSYNSCFSEIDVHVDNEPSIACYLPGLIKSNIIFAGYFSSEWFASNALIDARNEKLVDSSDRCDLPTIQSFHLVPKPSLQEQIFISIQAEAAEASA